MTHENHWPIIPSFTCSLNFANCRLRAASFAKNLSSSLGFVSGTGDKMESAISDSFDDVSGDECESVHNSWTQCHTVCPITEMDENHIFDISPGSPIDGEIVVNPPVPLPPLLPHSEEVVPPKYGSFDSCDDRQCLVCECDSGNGSTSAPIVEVPELLSAVSDHLTKMIDLDRQFQDHHPHLYSSSSEEHLERNDKLYLYHTNVKSCVCGSIYKSSENKHSETLQTQSISQSNSRMAGTELSLECHSPDLQNTIDEVRRSVVDLSLDEDGNGYLTPVKLQRSTSLKTGKTPPETPHRKKIVRFADAMGLDLEAVKQITQEDLPTVPKSAYNDLEIPDLDESPMDSPIGSFTLSAMYAPKVYVPFDSSKMTPFISDFGARTLQMQFTVPGLMPNFWQRVNDTKVCLDQVTVSELSVSCIVTVTNMHYNKKVAARFTTNEWASCNDMSANYVQCSNTGDTDQFSFTIFVPQLSLGQRLCFALKYQAGDEEYWDNNYGLNYCFKCEVLDLDPMRNEENGWHHFL